MNVGFITVHRAPNYGAMLQCFALQQYIEGMGHECKVIDLLRPYHEGFVHTEGFEPFDAKKIHKSFVGEIRKFIGHYLHRYEANNKKFAKVYKENLKRRQELFDAFDKRITYTKQYKSIGELYANPPQFDVYITGSDQLWNPTQPYCIEPFFLTFVKNGAKKISYATSIGLSSLPESINQQYIKWLNDYDYISVREQEAVNMLSKGISKTIHKVVDPTLLMDKQFWERLAVVKPEFVHEKYVFCFTLSYLSELHSYLKKYAKEKGMKYVYIVHAFQDAPYTNKDKNVIGLIDISPEEWLGLIQNAEEIFTNSFHGTVFSLIFEKKFYSYIPSNNKRGSRIVNVLEMIKLKNHIIYDIKNFIPQEERINYDAVNKILQEERKKGEAFLNLALNNK